MQKVGKSERQTNEKDGQVRQTDKGESQDKLERQTNEKDRQVRKIKK